MKDVCFREQYSYQLFKELENVRVANDVIFNYKLSEIYKEDKNTVLFSIIDFEKKGDIKKCKELYEYKVVELINRYIQNGYNIILMGFCVAEGDREAIERIRENKHIVDKSKIEIYIYKGNIKEAIGKIVKSNKVIATRFHSMILGYLLKKNVYTFIYSKKTENVLKDLQIEEYSDITKEQEIDTERIYRIMEEKREKFPIEDIVENAKLQFKGLDNFIQGEEG